LEYLITISGDFMPLSRRLVLFGLPSKQVALGALDDHALLDRLPAERLDLFWRQHLGELLVLGGALGRNAGLLQDAPRRMMFATCAAFH
jgi:hypothetical protein